MLVVSRFDSRLEFLGDITSQYWIREMRSIPTGMRINQYSFYEMKILHFTFSVFFALLDIFGNFLFLFHCVVPLWSDPRFQVSFWGVRRHATRNFMENEISFTFEAFEIFGYPNCFIHLRSAGLREWVSLF